MKSKPVQIDFPEKVALGTERKCLFCGSVAPEDIPTAAMTYENAMSKLGWYSNGLIDVATGNRCIFYLCPEHSGRKKQMRAWDWARRSLSACLWAQHDG